MYGRRASARRVVVATALGAAVLVSAQVGSAFASRIPTDSTLIADFRPSAPSENQRTTRPESGSRPPGSSERRDPRPANPPAATGAPQPTTEAAKPTPPSAPSTPLTGTATRPTPPPSIDEAHHDDHGPRPTPPAGATIPPRPSVQPSSTPRTDDDRPARPTLTVDVTPPARPTLPPNATQRPHDDRPPLPPGATPERPPHRGDPDAPLPIDGAPTEGAPINDHLPTPFVPGPDPLILPPHEETPFVTTGTLATGTFVAFQVQGVPGHEVRVEASGFDTLVEVTGTDGATIATDDNGLGDALGGSATSFVVPADGMSTVTVRGVGDASGTYRVAVMPIRREADLSEAPPA